MAMVNLTRELAEIRCWAAYRSNKATSSSPLPRWAISRMARAADDWLEVDFNRPRIVHATFGAGAHYCMGSSLARAEIRIFLEEWLARIPDFAIAEGAGAGSEGWRGGDDAELAAGLDAAESAESATSPTYPTKNRPCELSSTVFFFVRHDWAPEDSRRLCPPSADKLRITGLGSGLIQHFDRFAQRWSMGRAGAWR